MENFSVSSILTLDDWQALHRAVHRRAFAGPPARRLMTQWPLLLIAFAPVVALLWLGADFETIAFMAGVLVALVGVIVQSRITRAMVAPKPGGHFLGPVRFEFSADGIRIVRSAMEFRLQWAAIHEIEMTATHVLLWIGNSSAYLFPARDLSGGLDAASATARLRAFKAQAGSATEGSAQPADFSAPPLLPEHLIAAPPVTVAAQLGAVARALLLLRVDPARIAGSDAAIAALAAIALAIWLPLDRLVYDGPMDFMVEQIGGLCFVVVGALALAFVLSRLSVPALEYRRVLLVVTGSMFIAIAGSMVFNLFAERWIAGTAALLAATAYAMLYFKNALRALTGSVPTRALLGGAVATFLFIVMMDRLYINPGLWMYTGDEDAELTSGTNYQDAWRRIEELQFDQRARLDAQVASIAAHSAAGAQMYFVGFAGYGEQRVFAQEIGLAAKQVAQRYGAGERQILLVNDRRDLEKYPLATPRALRHTLVSLGKVMDADDVLFLSLSSHGDEDATLSISNSGMMPGELDSTQLADALRESGIRWKVVVLSACHAASFIDALADDHTIVLTAAAADRTSFGCTDDRDLTYFGEAFYRDALPKAASLHAAFDAAKAAIAQREKAEGIEPSNPQASYGTALEAHLEAIE